MSILAVLTEDLLIRVNSKLEHDSDRKSWRLVCKEFLQVDSLTRTTLRILRPDFIFSLLRTFANVEELDLSVCPRVDDGTLTLLLDRGGTAAPSSFPWNLRGLNLSRTNGMSCQGLELIGSACPKLERLDVSCNRRLGDREAAAISGIVGLKELKMDKCMKVSDVGLVKIAVGCQKLEKLSLKWCMEISDLGVHLLCVKCSNLKAIDISYLKVTNESLHSIASLPKLEGLTMVGCPLVNDSGLGFLSSGSSLKEIDISRCEGVSSSGLVSIIRAHCNLNRISIGYLPELSDALLDCLKNLKNLTTLVILGTQVSDAVLRSISIGCKSLHEIALSKCTGVTNAGVVQLLYRELKALDLTCCDLVTNAVIHALAESCRSLVCLKLESCFLVTDKGLYHLASSCVLLEEVDLTDCSGINDSGLEYLSRCSRLLTLKLGLCFSISDKGVSCIASNCSNLCELDLYRCTGIGDGTLAALANGCTRLKKLNISYCTKITDEGMKSLGHLQELFSLEMRSLRNVTGVGFAAFATMSKRLAELDMKCCENIDDAGFIALACYCHNLRQVNLSQCNISDAALSMVMGNLTRLQEAKLLHLPSVTMDGFELALRACCSRIKKVKMVSEIRPFLSSEVLEILRHKGCIIRWD
ncbi:F-box/LRR-repeat protein 3 [Linum grandiflorum]